MKLINKQGRPLSAFHSGDIEIKGTFPCSHSSWISFETEERAKDYKKTMLYEIEKGRERRGEENYKKAIKFINNLRITS